ncbi:MAG TPA: FAD-binding dehydrogenase [Isosphaeraceae bacterium]
MRTDTDVVVVGAGLSGLVAAAELVDAGRRVVVLDQESEASLGGQAYWSFGGLFLVDTPEQRRLGIRDSHDLALQDWMATAAFDREEDHWPRRWAEAYVAWAAGEKRAWLRAQGVRFFPVVGWAERGGYLATEHGNSVPRFHITWGTGPGVVEPFARRAREAERRGRLAFHFRHRVTGLTVSGGVFDGVTGEVLAPDSAARGRPSSREVVGDFTVRAQAVVITSGGIGGNHGLVRAHWPERLAPPPRRLLCGVPAYVDGHMLGVTEAAGGRLINRDRMWHYPEGVANWDPTWPLHGIRILPGPSSVWLDARGNRLPAPLFPGFDSLGTLAHIARTGYDHSWFLLNQRIFAKEFALAGSEHNPDLTNRSWRQVLGRAGGREAPPPIEALKRCCTDVVVEARLPGLVLRMNELAGDALLDAAAVEQVIVARDREVENPFTKDAQVTAIRVARRYLGDRLFRTAKPHRVLDPSAGPLIAVRLSVLTRKTLGGLATDLSGRVLTADGSVLPGLYAAGEAAGFGGGGMHGYRALEGMFLGGCLFSGRVVGRAAASHVV